MSPFLKNKNKYLIFSILNILKGVLREINDSLFLTNVHFIDKKVHLIGIITIIFPIFKTSNKNKHGQLYYYTRNLLNINVVF